MNVCEVSFQSVNSFFVYKPFSVAVSQYCFTMGKIEYRAVIKFLFLEGVAPKEIHERMLKLYNDCSPTIRTLERWVAEFSVVVQALKTIHVKDVQKAHQHQKP